jgi:hypothetical protein
MTSGTVRDLGVGWKVAVVGSVGLLTALAVGGFGWRSLNVGETTFVSTVDQVARPAIELGDMREAYARVRSRLAQAAAWASQKDITSALGKMQSYRDGVIEGIDHLEAAGLGEAERQAISQALRPNVEKAFALIKEQMLPLANHPMTRRAAPVHRVASHAARTSAESQRRPPRRMRFRAAWNDVGSHERCRRIQEIANNSSEAARVAYQLTIASAVEQQTNTTADMSRHLGDAASGSSEIAKTIESVASAASDSDSGIGHASTVSNELAGLARELDHLVSQFRV